jgi:hypothetical protein
MSFLSLRTSFPLGALFVASSCLLASCMCGGSPSCQLDLSPHCDAGAPVPHGHLDGNETFFACAVECDPGFANCNGISSDGCESATACPSPFDPPDGGDAGAVLTEAMLDDVPKGLAVCGGVPYVLDGDVVKVFRGNGLNVATLAVLPAPAAGGLACAPNGVGVVFVQRGADALPPSVVRIEADAATALAVAIDPAPGVVADDGGIFWPEHDDAGAHLVRWSEDAATPLGPVDLSPVDKPFARSGGTTWLLSGGQPTSPDDAAVPKWDGGALVALAADEQGLGAVTPGADGGAIVVGFADGGVAWTNANPHTVRVVRRAGGTTFVGFDDGIGRFGADGTFALLAVSQLHVVDVAVDETWIWWVTLGDGSEPPMLRRLRR